MSRKKGRAPPLDEGRSASAKRQRADRAFASSILSAGYTSGTTSLADYTAASTSTTRRIVPRLKISVARPALPVVSQPPVGARWDFEECSRPADDHSGVKYVVTDARDNSVSLRSLIILTQSPFTYSVTRRTYPSRDGGSCGTTSDASSIASTLVVTRFIIHRHAQAVDERTTQHIVARTACSATSCARTACLPAMHGFLFI
jgi:hypothetical protein